MTRSVRARVGAGLLSLAILLPVTAATPAVAAAADFPIGWEGYHTYAEMVADIDAEVAAHPAIIEKLAIGHSYQGRTIWAVKISDNVAVDENEPEVLFDGLTHSDEHMGLEMTLHIMHWLVDGYGHDSRITGLVNNREVWIVLAVNPDGAEYDISGGKFHYWRKNRQPNAGTTAIGTDINRNFGYHWGIAEGRTSRNPAAITYMGPKAFSTPEARNIRDFLASRVVNGRQQIRAAITFHESGRLVMWPYGYTYTDVPSDMTVQDHDALAKLGKLMASTNGYRPEQASDLYLTSGTTRDYEYGMYRIYAYTFELSVTDYPDDSLIASETGRNKAAVLDLLTWATCPIGILGVAVRTARCGVFDDDFEVYRGWVRNADGTDTATSGAWQRGTPQQTTTATGVKQPGSVTSGRYAIVTGGAAGSNANANDLDGGTTSVTSPAFTLKTPPHQMLQFRYSFAHDAASTSADSFVVQVLDVAANTRTAVFAIHGAATNRNGGWASASVDLSAFAGRSVRLVFSATDGGPNNLVEAAFDDVRVTQPQ